MNEARRHGVRACDESDPGYARAWNNLGNALRVAGRGAEAVRAVERAVAADSGYALAWSNLGALKRDYGRRRTAPRLRYAAR